MAVCWLLVKSKTFLEELENKTPPISIPSAPKAKDLAMLTPKVFKRVKSEEAMDPDSSNTKIKSMIVLHLGTGQLAKLGLKVASTW